jgi:DNA-binding response OmpR family regulator
MPNRRRALIVDDNAVHADALVQFLRDDGWNAEWAANVASAKIKLQVFRSDVVVIDFYLPDEDGLSFYHWLMGHQLGHKPCILFTTAAGQGTIDHIVRESSGRAHVLRKPFGREEFLAALASVFDSPECHRSE